jgi:TPR repeat protein
MTALSLALRLARQSAGKGSKHGLFMLGWGVAHDNAEALRWLKLAAAQGLSEALYRVGHVNDMDYSVDADNAEAIRWYKCAQAAGNSQSFGLVTSMQ